MRQRPTADDKKQQWTPETLKKYEVDRGKAQADKVFRDQNTRPLWANSRYNPLRKS